MSKIGKKLIVIPEGVEVVVDGAVVRVKGPKGELSETLLDGVSVAVADATIAVSVDSEEKRNLWGLYRSLIANMVVGVSEGYEKKLHVIGVGYGAQVQGQKLVLSLGYSHKIDFVLPDIISASVEQDSKGNAIITLQSIDKQLIGQAAAKIRDLRRPEPYKGKGVRYFGEEVKLKPGKAAAK